MGFFDKIKSITFWLSTLTNKSLKEERENQNDWWCYQPIRDRADNVVVYIDKVFDVISSYGLDCHSQVDDMQVYISVAATTAQAGLSQLADCSAHLNRWLTVNRLKVNDDKTEQLIWPGTRQQLAKLTVTQLRLTSSVVEFDSTATNLGVVLDNQLSTDLQVSSIHTLPTGLLQCRTNWRANSQMKWL